MSIQAQIIALLKRLCREHGTAVMLVTHDMGVIAETADRVAVMYAGRIAEIGPVRDVDQARRSIPTPKGLMGSIPRIGERARAAAPDRRRDAAPDRDPAGLRLQPALPAARSTAACVERPELMAAGASRAACWLHDDRRRRRAPDATAPMAADARVRRRSTA